MKKLGITLTEAGISGASMIPMMVFVTTLIRNNGRLDYILPFVIFYSFLKIGAFTVSVFGEVNNPFRLAQFASLTVILGFVLILSKRKPEWIRENTEREVMMNENSISFSVWYSFLGVGR